MLNLPYAHWNGMYKYIFKCCTYSFCKINTSNHVWQKQFQNANLWFNLPLIIFVKVFNEIHTVLFIFCRLSSSAIWRPVFKTTSSSITKNLNSFFSRTIESFDKWFSPIDPQTACAHSKCKQCFMQISFRAKALGGGISDPKKSYSQMNTKKII